MLGTGIQGVSSAAFLAVPFLGSGLNEVLLLLTRIMGLVVLSSFVITRLVRFFIK